MVRELLKEGQKASLIDTVGTLTIASLKAVIGFISGSVALTADAVHDFSDSLVTIASWAGLKIAEKKPTKKFPYGYYKAENFSAFVISLFFIYVGIEILLESVRKLFLTPSIEYAGAALIVPIISAVYAWMISRYLEKVGKRIHSQSLIAISKEAKLHMAIAASVFLGILSSYFHVRYIEALVGFAISLFIFKIALTTAKDAFLALMDVSPDKDIERKVKEVLRKQKLVESFEDLKLRRSGPFIFGEVKIKVKGSLNVKEAHEISDRIEETVKKAVDNLDSFTVHVEPSVPEVKKVAVPVSESKGMKSKISPVSSRSNLIALIDIEKKKVRRIKIIENPAKKRKIRAGLSFARELIKRKVNVVLVKSIGSIAFHTLRDNFVDVCLVKSDTIEEAVKEFINTQCKPLKKPVKEVE